MAGKKAGVLIAVLVLLVGFSLYFVFKSITIGFFALLVVLGLLSLFFSFHSRGHISRKIYMQALLGKFALFCYVLFLVLCYFAYVAWQNAESELLYILTGSALFVIFFFSVITKLRVRQGKHHVSHALRYFR